MSVNKPVKVRLSDDFDRDKLSLGSESRDMWVDNTNSEHPRNGILHKGEEYTVDAKDPVITHFLDGGTLIRTESPEGKTFEEKLDDLPYIGEERAERITEDFNTFEEFREEVDIEYLSDMEGIGHSRAEKILDEVK